MKSAIWEMIQTDIHAPAGFKASGVWCGIKPQREDLAVIFSEEESIASAFFTSNKVKAAPVKVSQEHLKRSRGRVRAIVANSGCANACTGPEGLHVAKATADCAAKLLRLDPREILVASTGVIGKLLDVAKIKEGLPRAVSSLSVEGFPQAAKAIMTTDTHPKTCAVTGRVDGKEVRIVGMAKGAGMINPCLATMFAFITSDVDITPRLLAKAFKQTVERTFNAISVDGDTSTNDTVVVIANGAAGNRKIAAEDKRFDYFCAGLQMVCEHLAKAIVRDGEGATKFVEVGVKKARNETQAKTIAKAIANSVLVKTALFGRDPNWGRIICAAGYSGAHFNPDVSDLYINSECVMRSGAACAFDLAKVQEQLKQPEVKIDLHLNQGRKEALVWTCDLSHDYINSNSDYTT